MTLDASSALTTSQTGVGGSASCVPVPTTINIGGQTASSTDFAVTTTNGDFTIECWVRFPTGGVNSWQGYVFGLEDIVTSATNNYLAFSLAPYATSLYTTGQQLVVANAANISAGTVRQTSGNVWHHLAITRSAGTTLSFIDGVLIQTTVNSNASYSWASNTNMTFFIGNKAGVGGVACSFAYHIDEVRFTRGKARYTAAFTALAEVDWPDAGCVTLLNFNGSNGDTSTIDPAGSHTFTFTNGSQLSTAQKKFGVSSLYLDGTNDYLTTPRSAGFNLIGADFTVECWVGIVLDVSSGTFNIINNWNGTDGWELKIVNGKIVGKLAATTTVTLTGTTSLGFNASPTFHHICFQRQGSILKIYYNGVVEASGTINGASTLGASTPTIIGANNGASAEWFPGYIDDLRVVKNYNMYDITGFTPPTAQISNDLTIHGSGAV